MRTNEERIAALHARAEELRRERRKRRTRLAGAAGIIFCLALTVGLAAWIPHLSTVLSGTPDSMSGSVFSDSGALGYLVTALLAFLLGVCVTVFCLRLKKWREDRDQEDRL